MSWFEKRHTYSNTPMSIYKCAIEAVVFTIGVMVVLKGLTFIEESRGGVALLLAGHSVSGLDALATDVLNETLSIVVAKALVGGACLTAGAMGIVVAILSLVGTLLARRRERTLP